jgi:hypothetical protein
MQFLSNYPFVHVILLPIFFILFLFSYNQDELILQDLFTPLFFACVIVITLMIVFRFFSKNIQKNYLILSMVIILFFVYGHVFMTFDDLKIEQFDIGRHLFILPIFFGIFIFSIFLIRNYFDHKITFFVNVISITLVLLSLSNIVTFEILAESEPNSFIELNLNPEIHPNIYYIILDEYAGETSLQNYYNFDNSEFLNYLKSKGFFIASNSYSNYPYTGLSTATTLNMNYIDFLIKSPDNNSAKPVLELYQKNNVMKIFNDNDYSTIHIYGGVRERVQIADINLCERYLTTDFPNLIFRTTFLTIVHTQFLSHDWREIRLCAYDELSTIHEKYSEPFFVLAHLRLPHDPFTFGPNGEVVDNNAINLELSSSGNISNYLDQLEFTNKKTSELLETLLNLKNPPIIVIQSDHGARFSIDWENPDIPDHSLQRAFDNLYAIYYPHENYDSYYSNITNVNTFRIIFNDIFNEEFEILEDKIFLSTPSKQYDFKDITKKIFYFPEIEN